MRIVFEKEYYRLWLLISVVLLIINLIFVIVALNNINDRSSTLNSEYIADRNSSMIPYNEYIANRDLDSPNIIVRIKNYFEEQPLLCVVHMLSVGNLLYTLCMFGLLKRSNRENATYFIVFYYATMLLEGFVLWKTRGAIFSLCSSVIIGIIPFRDFVNARTTMLKNWIKENEGR